MKLKEIFIIGLMFVSAITFAWIYRSHYVSFPEACFSDKCFNLEIADEDSERTVGLMNRTYLDENSGMIFIWETDGQYSFWMKNTLIPLDIIWIDESKEIVFIKENASPMDLTPITPGVEAKYVIELNAGSVNKNNIAVGEQVQFKKIYG